MVPSRVRAGHSPGRPFVWEPRPKAQAWLDSWRIRSRRKAGRWRAPAREGTSCVTWAGFKAVDRQSGAAIGTSLAGPHFTTCALRPLVCATVERPALRVHHAKALPGRRFHHPPALHVRDPPRAELLQALHFRFQVVGLDVEVDAAGVVDLLHEQHGLVRPRLE